MPKIRIEPPRGGDSFFDFVGQAFKFLAAPWEVGREFLQRSQNRIRDQRLLLPVVIDTDTNQVRVEYSERNANRFDTAQARFIAGRGGNPAAQRGMSALLKDSQGRQAEPILQQLWLTGEAPPLPWGFADVRDVVLQLRAEYFEPPEEIPAPTPEPEPTTFWNLPSVILGTPMAIIPPGGMTAFQQQVPAAKLALTRGMRGGKRKRRKKRAKRARNTAARRGPSRRRGTALRSKRRARLKKRLVKGSAAAKRFMAKLRRMRRR